MSIRPRGPTMSTGMNYEEQFGVRSIAGRLDSMQREIRELKDAQRQTPRQVPGSGVAATLFVNGDGSTSSISDALVSLGQQVKLLSEKQAQIHQSLINITGPLELLRASITNNGEHILLLKEYAGQIENNVKELILYVQEEDEGYLREERLDEGGPELFG